MASVLQSQHAGQVILAARLARVLRNDPMMGIVRHADAGDDDEAMQCGREQSVDIPMQN